MMAERGKQPQCQGPDCNHPLSFHGGGKTRCRALGCRCKRWVGSKRQAAAKAR